MEIYERRRERARILGNDEFATPCISVAGERTIERNRERCYTIISMLFPWAPLRFVSPARARLLLPRSKASYSPLRSSTHVRTHVTKQKFASAADTKGNNRDTGFPPIPCTRQYALSDRAC